VAIPFATADDLAVRLNRAVWTDSGELAQVNQFLADASDLLRAEIGWQVYPPVEVAVVAYPDLRGRIHLPGLPRSVTSVVDADGVTMTVEDYELLDGVIHLHRLGRFTITYTVGHAAPPVELLRWTCVIAAQLLARAADDDLGGGTASSESLADYRISYSEQQQLGELPVPQRVLDRLRSAYGSGVYAA
jgi:hypothetical protein